MSSTRTAPDLLSTLTTGWNDAMQQWWEQSQTVFDPWKQAWDTVLPGVAGQARSMPSGRHRPQGSRPHGGRSCGCEQDGCESCGCESCECESGIPANRGHRCVPDADVLVQARAGEQRVIPFVLRNPWRRERTVSIAIGPWQVCGGDGLEVQAVVEAGESLTLQPHEKRVVRLMVTVRGICDETKDTKGNSKGDQKDDQPFGCDVRSCAGAYADVRFEGCARPQRVGVVVHPASCDAVELPCDCGCSCG